MPWATPSRLHICTHRYTYSVRRRCQPALDRPGGHLGTRAEPELAQDVLDVIGGCPLCDYQCFADCAVAQATRDQRSDFPFALRERVIRPAGPRRVWVGRERLRDRRLEWHGSAHGPGRRRDCLAKRLARPAQRGLDKLPPGRHERDSRRVTRGRGGSGQTQRTLGFAAGVGEAREAVERGRLTKLVPEGAEDPEALAQARPSRDVVT